MSIELEKVKKSTLIEYFKRNGVPEKGTIFKDAAHEVELTEKKPAKIYRNSHFEESKSSWDLRFSYLNFQNINTSFLLLDVP